jgi:hypothetical protein
MPLHLNVSEWRRRRYAKPIKAYAGMTINILDYGYEFVLNGATYGYKTTTRQGAKHLQSEAIKMLGMVCETLAAPMPDDIVFQ